MKIKIGTAQIPNSTDLKKNFATIMSLLERFQMAGAELVLFPEWSSQTGVEVILPTAFSQNGLLYNSGWWINPTSNKFFYKIGLTESENNFFSLPEKPHSKLFETKGFRFAVLICYEAEHDAWTYFKPGDVDVVLWPGYWGWTPKDKWGSNKSSGNTNPIHANNLS